MTHQSRRNFLSQVGQGMLVAGVGYKAALDIGLTTAWAEDSAADKKATALHFGKRERLVRLMQETPVKKLLPKLVKQLKNGTELRDLVAAAALANARTFGGQDYVGFHTMMALGPAYQIAQEMPKSQQALPVLKVLYRNTHRIGQHGGQKSEVLRRVNIDELASKIKNKQIDGKALLNCIRNKKMEEAEKIFAAISQGSAEDSFNELLIAVQDKSEVHRIVMPYRAWDLLDVVGQEHAHTMLRQSVRYCVKNESEKYDRSCKGGRDLLPKLLDQYKLLSKPVGSKKAEDKWIAEMSETIFKSNPEQAADAVAAALAEGMSPLAVGEAMSLAANQLVLRDVGRMKSQVRPGKPLGSVHGASIGVHACDSANAWRNMALVSNKRNAIACLILGAHQVAFDRSKRGGKYQNWQPYPHEEHLEKLEKTPVNKLLQVAEVAIRKNDQKTACAAVARYSQSTKSSAESSRNIFKLLRKYTISEDGALHAEKYYRTARDEYTITREAFRLRQLLALTRVVASEYGFPAPGHAEAVRLLGG